MYALLLEQHIFDDMIGRIKTGIVGFKETTLEFIIQYEDGPFLVPRINADGTFTAGYRYDFSEETDPEMFRRYFKRDANEKLQVIRTMTLQEARDFVKIAADKKGIIQELNNFINGTGNGNVDTPLSINQNQYDALFSYFYSNGGKLKKQICLIKMINGVNVKNEKNNIIYYV